MADLYIDSMKEALKNFHQQKMSGDYNFLSNNGQINLDDFYEALAWQGLSNIMNQNTDDPNDMINTQAWQSKSDLEKMWIENTIRGYNETGDKNCQL